jgi:hypothetical protein
MSLNKTKIEWTDYTSNIRFVSVEPYRPGVYPVFSKGEVDWVPKNGDPSFFDCDAEDPVPDSKESGYPDGKKPECFGAYYEGPRCDDCPLIKECVEYENSDKDDCPDCPDRDDCHQQCEQYTGGC